MHFDILTKDQKRKRRLDAERVWHRKFAWLPIRMTTPSARVVWLEYCCRKSVPQFHDTYRPKQAGRPEQWKWQYVETEFDILKMNESATIDK